MKCENCIHTKPCGEYQQKFLSHLKNLKVTDCPYYKDKDKVIELPCKVGDTVYGIFAKEVYPKEITRFEINPYTKPQLWIGTKFDFASESINRWDLAIGKTVFLTRKEAEKALKEGK